MKASKEVVLCECWRRVRKPVLTYLEDQLVKLRQVGACRNPVIEGLDVIDLDAPNDVSLSDERRVRFATE